MPHVMKFSDAKAAVDKNGKSLRLSQRGSWRKSEARRRSKKEAQKNKNKVYFASWMDICHLKNAELKPQFQKCKGCVVLRGNIVKDDSGTHAVFTEHGSSASQMTAAKVMDVISRLPTCAGQAADAKSAYTQVKLEDVPKLLKLPESGCPDTWIRLPDTNGPNHRNILKTPLFLLRETYTERGNSKKYCWNFSGKKYRIGNVCMFTENNHYFYRCGRFLKMAGKKQNLAPMWKKLMKNIDLDEPTSFLDHVYLGCTQRECRPDEIVVEKHKEMFESRISAGAMEKLPGWAKPHAKTVAWSYDMEGHAQKMHGKVSRIGE